MTSPSECPHEALNEKGRCTVCGVWAVLTGQVTVPVKPARPKDQSE